MPTIAELLSVDRGEPFKRCWRKKAYPTAWHALQDRARIERETGERRPTMPYECPHCSQFHLGKSSSVRR